MQSSDIDRILAKEELQRFIDDVGVEFDVFGPTHRGGGTADYSYPTFGRIDQAHPLLLEYGVSMVSLKEVFFPDNQTLYEFDRDGGEVDVVERAVEWERPRAFIAIHTCDIAALQRLDMVLLEDKFVDERYRGKRERSVIIGLTCDSCRSSCFCSSSGSGPDIESGYDVLMTDIGNAYFVRAGSETGVRLLEREYFVEATEDARAERDRRLREVEASLPDALDVSAIAEKIYDGDVDEVLHPFADRCFTCGACNLVCPTCHCFTFTNRMTSEGTHGSRHLIWDACHFAKFSTMAGNVNARPEKDMRFRHRIFDKFGYDYRRYGSVFCVGCGRCLEFCPGHISIRSAAKAIQESE